MKNKLENLISGYRINDDDAAWLRGVLHNAEQRNDLITTMTYLKANLSPSTTRQIDCCLAIQAALDKCKEN